MVKNGDIFYSSAYFFTLYYFVSFFIRLFYFMFSEHASRSSSLFTTVTNANCHAMPRVQTPIDKYIFVKSVKKSVERTQVVVNRREERNRKLVRSALPDMPFVFRMYHREQ